MSSNTTLKGYTRIPEDYTGDIWIEGQIAALEAELQRCRQALEQSAVSSVETYIHEFAGLPHPGDFGIPKGHWWQAKAYADQLCTTTLKQEPVAWITEAAWGTDVSLEKPDFGKAEWKAPEPKVTALYPTLPTREWQNLTEAEIRDIRKRNQSHDAFAHAIENKLKEKNT